ncbi:MAG: outer membrane protein TolC, partial [Myxococcota bacterium]
MFRCLSVAMFLVLFCGPAQAQTLTLEQTWDSALAHSDDLETIRASVLRARAGRRRALAAMLPSLTASGRFRLNEEAVSLGGQTLRPQTEVSGSLVVDLGIFDGRAWPTFSAAGQQIQLARLRLEDARSLVLVDVAGTYYTALALRQLLNVAKGAVASRQKHLEAAEARLEAGHAVRLDVERARAAVHRADRDRIDTEH